MILFEGRRIRPVGRPVLHPRPSLAAVWGGAPVAAGAAESCLASILALLRGGAPDVWRTLPAQCFWACWLIHLAPSAHLTRRNDPPRRSHSAVATSEAPPPPPRPAPHQRPVTEAFPRPPPTRCPTRDRPLARQTRGVGWCPSTSLEPWSTTTAIECQSPPAPTRAAGADIWLGRIAPWCSAG